MSEHANLSTWEHAEVARSRVQATLSEGVRKTTASVFRRYGNATADSLFPLEYVYFLIGDVRGLSVLDYGCGDGRDTTLLAARGARVCALDLSPDLLQRAAARVRLDGYQDAVRIMCGSAHAVPLPDASVDLVFGHAILHHLDLESARREVFRVLRPGGRAIFKEPIRESRLLRAIRPLIPYRQPDVSPFERPLRLSEIEFFSQPFVRTRSRLFMLPFVRLVTLRGASKAVETRTMALDARLLASLPWLRTYATALVFELRKPVAGPQ